MNKGQIFQFVCGAVICAIGLVIASSNTASSTRWLALLFAASGLAQALVAARAGRLRGRRKSSRR